MAKWYEKYELHIYWDDGVTVECRYFPTSEAAEKYAKDNGIINYMITLNDIEDVGELRIWDGGYNQRKLKKEGLEIVTWPDSQYLTETIGHRNHSWLINDNYGLNRFGSCAYVVEGDWYNENV